MKASCLSPLTKEQGPLQQKVVLSSPLHPEEVEGGSFHTGLRGNGGRGGGKDRKKAWAEDGRMEQKGQRCSAWTARRLECTYVLQ